MQLEAVLRQQRKQAMQLLADNKDQLRDGVEALLKERMPAILVASRRPGEATLPDSQADQLYVELLSLAYSLFAMGYSISQAAQTATPD